MKNFVFFIAFLLLMTGEVYAKENTPEMATTTPSVIENLSPEALFDQIRGFLTIPIHIPNISIPALETPDFDTSGIRNLNEQIREIAGVDILRFLGFLWHIFLAAVRYIWELIPGTTGFTTE
ncbi:MAG: hypothetical protein Q7R73_04745 [bacterium]|nr:hypothetical protein [bacterium]